MKKYFTLSVIIIAVVSMGQSCSISFGDQQPTSGGIYRSDDSGKTWKQKSYVRTEKKKTITISGVSVKTIVIPSNLPNVLLLGTQSSGIWRSIDSGDHWKQSSIRSGSYACLSYVPSDPTVWYTSSGTNILKSTNTGETWTSVYQESQPGNSVTCVEADAKDPNTVWAITSGGKILQSKNGGNTWTLVNTLKKLNSVIRLYSEPAEGQRLVIFTNRNIFAIDGSENGYTDLTQSLNSRELRGASTISSVTILPNGHWYLGTKHGPIVSYDQGQSWRGIPTVIVPGTTTIPNLAVNPVNEKEMFITVGTKIHHTLDYGETWSVNNSPTTLPMIGMQFDPRTTQRVWFGTYIPEKK